MEYRLVALVEEEVKDAHVGLEAVLPLIYLIITSRDELRVWERMLGANGLAEIRIFSVES